MIKFEKDASDPGRLFRSSFQLVQEEKFRKTAFPSLVKLENDLIKRIQKWEIEKSNVFTFDGDCGDDGLEDTVTDENASYLKRLVS